MMYRQHDPLATLDILGFLPMMFSDKDPRPAKEQANSNYAHGGGWLPMTDWTYNPDTMEIQWSDEKPYSPMFSTKLHESDHDLPTETIVFYQSAWVSIVQEDGSFQVSRMD